MKRMLLTFSGLALLQTTFIAAANQPPQGAPHQQQQPMMNMQRMMPMMMEMHKRHTATANAWAAGRDGVFVVRDGKLLKYGDNLKIVKTVDLPKEEMQDAAQSSKTAAGKSSSNRPAKPGQMQQKMKQMMAQMHGGLPVEIHLTRKAVFVSQGNHLLSYDHDLNLQAQTELPAVQPKPCPMCQMMMQKMQENQNNAP